jgi:hypothetical protein
LLELLHECDKIIRQQCVFAGAPWNNDQYMDRLTDILPFSRVRAFRFALPRALI